MVINVVTISVEISCTVWNLHSGRALSEGPPEDTLRRNNLTSSWCRGSELGLILAPTVRGHWENSRNI